MYPMFSLLNLVMASMFPYGTELPLNSYWPDVGVSIAAIMFSSVVFPEPLGPINSIDSPLSTSRLTLSTAMTSPDE